MICPLCQQKCQSFPFQIAEGLRYFCTCSPPNDDAKKDQIERFVYGAWSDGSVRYFYIRALPCVFHYTSAADGWFIYTAQYASVPQQSLAKGQGYLSPEQAYQLLLRYQKLIAFS